MIAAAMRLGCNALIGMSARLGRVEGAMLDAAEWLARESYRRGKGAGGPDSLVTRPAPACDQIFRGPDVRLTYSSRSLAAALSQVPTATIDTVCMLVLPCRA